MRLLLTSFLLAGCVLCASAVIVYADDTAKPVTPTVSIVENDEVYFEVKSFQRKEASASLPATFRLKKWEREKQTPDERNTASDEGLYEFVIRNTPDNSYSLVAKAGKTETELPFTAQQVFPILAEKIAANPTSPDKWEVKLETPEANITLRFAGVRRFYELKSVQVPENDNSSIRNINRNWYGTAPQFRVYIDRNGKAIKPTSGLMSDKLAWKVDFPSGGDNWWEIREGNNDRYAIRLRDAGNWMGWEVFLLDIPNLTAEHFKRGEVVETVDQMMKERAVRCVFGLAR